MEKPRAAAHGGSTVDANALYDVYADMVYRLALVRTKSVHDAQDVLHTVFVKCLEKPPQFNDQEHEKAWMLRATLHACNTLLSSAWRRRTTAHQDQQIGAYDPPAAWQDEVYRAVLALPKHQRAAIHLHYYEGYRLDEIADMMETKTATVKSWLFRARNKLRNTLEGMEIEDVH